MARRRSGLMFFRTSDFPLTSTLEIKIQGSNDMRAVKALSIFSCLFFAALMAFVPLKASAENFEEYGKRIDRELSQIREGIDRMAEQAEESGKKAGDAFHRNLDQAEDSWEETKDALSRFREKGKAGMDEMRRGVDDAMQRLRNAFEDARKELR
jgi:predicted  nucleic acid-binding Zn-ribbon protein